MSFADISNNSSSFRPYINPERLRHSAEDEDDERELQHVRQVLQRIQKRRDDSYDHQLEITQSEQEYLAWVVREREELVRKLAADMRTTHELMQDISRLVDEQGLWIDSIEANIENVKVNTDKAKDELRKAYKEKKKSRERGCMAAGAAGIGALILALIVGSAVRPH